MINNKKKMNINLIIINSINRYGILVKIIKKMNPRYAYNVIRNNSKLRKKKDLVHLIQNRKFVESSLIVPAVSIITVGSGAISCMWLRYKIANADEYVVRTGLGIKDIAISKTAFLWPFQKYKMIKMEPSNYSFELHAITKDKIMFTLPATFTIGPKNDLEELKRYVRLLENVDGEGSRESKISIIAGLIEGETRTQSSLLTIEEIFSDRQAFKDKVIDCIQKELDHLGLWIINANIKELKDSAESRYFYNSSRKKEMETENIAKIDIAQAEKLGNIGQKEREAETRQKVIQYEAETVKLENMRRQEMVISNTELSIVKAEQDKLTNIARIEAINAANIRQAELEKEVERKRIESEAEKIRAIELSKAMADADTLIKTAEGESNAIKIKAEAQLYAKQKEAEGYLYAKQKEADGIYSILCAQSNGLNELIKSVGNDANTLIKYLMVDKGIYVDLAKANATAIKEMNPKINIWSTGNEINGNNTVVKTLTDIYKMLPPLVETIHEQTGLTPLDYLTKMSDKNKKDE